MRRLVLVALLSLTTLALAGSGLVRAQSAETPLVPMTFSQFLRAAGFNLTDAEMSYLDGDERIEQGYILAMTNIQLLGATPAEQQTDQWRQSLTSELNRLIQFDPSGALQAPPSLQRFRELGVEHRRQLQQAAQQWLAGLQAGDAQWAIRGAEAERAAGEAYLAWMQELSARFPPPEQPAARP